MAARRGLPLLLAVATALHLVLAWRLALGQDEAYTLAVTGPWQLSFFDHPPLSFWLSTLMQAAFGPEVTPLAMRLPFLVMATGSIWVLHALTARFFGARAGLWAAGLYAAAPFFFASAGGWVMPDGPLMLFLLLAAWQLADALAEGEGARWRPWLLAGLFLGLALLSKYQAVLTLCGAFLLLFAPRHRHWLTRPQPYVAVVLALLVFSPVLIWNAQNEWASFAFQLGRGGGAGAGNTGRWLGMVLREAIYLLPWSFAGMLVAAFAAVRAKVAGAAFFLCLGVPMVLLFNIQPLFGPTGQAHWSMAGWLFLFPLLGWLMSRSGRVVGWAMAGASTVTILAIAGLALVFADRHSLVVDIPGLEVFTAESVPWTGVREGLEADGLLDRPNTFLAARNWRDTAKFAETMRRPVVALGTDPRGFAYLSRPADYLGQDALVPVPPGEMDAVRRTLEPSFASVETVGTYPTYLDGAVAFEITILLARDFHTPQPRRYGLR
jgi:4-amino-4-deoxy-L-arabinose transferase-like glycosyltransferase